MLRKVLTTDEPVRFLLLSDPAVFEAQLVAARLQLESELEKPSDGMVDMLIDVIGAVAGNNVNHVFALQAAREGFAGFIKTFVSNEADQKTADEKFREALNDRELREAMAFIRAQAAVNMYRESLDVNDLCDPDPADATWVTCRALTRQEIRLTEQKAGTRPRLGAMLYSQCVDAARKASRNGEDAAIAYARHLASFDKKEMQEVEKFELWQEAADRLVSEAGLLNVDGFDFKPDGGKFPVDEFSRQVVEGHEVLSEMAKNIRQISSLGKPQSLSSHSPSGIVEQDAEA